MFVGSCSRSYGFSSSHVQMWELDHKEKLSTEELMLLNCDARENSWKNPLDSKEIKLVNPKGNQPWIFSGRTDAEAPILWPPDEKSQLIGKDPNALMLRKIEAGGEAGNRGWDGWMASLAQWTWIWACSRSWWWAGKPGMLPSIGSQRVRHYWATDLNWP